MEAKVQVKKCLHSLEYWGHGFEFHMRHVCMSSFILCLCCVYVDRDLAARLIRRPRSPNNCLRDSYFMFILKRNKPKDLIHQGVFGPAKKPNIFNNYTVCFKESFTNLIAYIFLFRGHVHCTVFWTVIMWLNTLKFYLGYFLFNVTSTGVNYPLFNTLNDW
jgi:hypothetical protein